MKNLIGRRCSCVFNLPSHEWPIPGYPAWVRVVSVDMPMIELTSDFYVNRMWINCSIIKTIQADADMPPLPETDAAERKE